MPKYIEKKPDGKGGWNYIYREPAKATTTGGYEIPHPKDEVYTKQTGMSKYNIKPSVLTAIGSDAGKLLRQRLPHFSQKDHLDAAKHHSEMANKLVERHTAKHKQFEKHAFGDNAGPMEHADRFRTSGGVHEKFTPEQNNELRALAHTATAHSLVGRAHSEASHGRFNPKADGGAKIPEATKSLASRIVGAIFAKAKYIRKESDSKGGWNYVYHDPTRRDRSVAHLDPKGHGIGRQGMVDAKRERERDASED